MAGYINAVLEEDPAALPLALRNLAEIGGMTALARSTGLNRTGLYNMLDKDGNPEWISLYKIMRALDVKITARAAGNNDHSTEDNHAAG